MAIPKILHYCWFGGGEMRKIEKKCIKTWDKRLNDFQWMRWDESNFDVHCNQYVSEAYKSQRYMYVSDYARLLALYEYGGLYLDTDCRVKKSFAPLMEQTAFTGIGCDNKELAAHLLAFEPKHPFIKECLDSYRGNSFIKDDGSYDTCSINIRMTKLLEKYGYIPNGQEQVIEGIHIYPMTYFCPWSLCLPEVKDCESKDTYCIHVWKSKEFKHEHRWYIKLGRKIGLDKLKRRILKR